MRRTLFSILIVFIALAGCNRDESSLNDYELFGRLQSGNGTWEVTRITTQNNDTKDPQVQELDTNGIFYHFYMQSEIISRVVVDYNAYSLYQDENLLSTGSVDAERQRVVFDGLQIGEGDVWTVEVNDANMQVWNSVSNNITTTMTLERCSCKVPYIGTENGG